METTPCKFSTSVVHDMGAKGEFQLRGGIQIIRLHYKIIEILFPFVAEAFVL